MGSLIQASQNRDGQPGLLPERRVVGLKARLRVALQYAVVPVTLLVLWEAAVRCAWVPNSLIASPLQVAIRLVRMLGDLTLLKNTLISLKRLSLGFGIGTAIGILTGVVVGASRVGARMLEPTILTLMPIPPIAWIPLLIILFGIGDVSKIALISLGSFSALFFSTSYGIRTADRNLVELARVLEKDRRVLIFDILLPAALPTILSSMRVALALSWTLLICSEVIASSSGLGWLIWDARNFSRADDMIVGMIAVGVLGKGSDWLLDLLERWVTRWRVAYRDLPNA